MSSGLEAGLGNVSQEGSASLEAPRLTQGCGPGSDQPKAMKAEGDHLGTARAKAWRLDRDAGK